MNKSIITSCCRRFFGRTAGCFAAFFLALLAGVSFNVQAALPAGNSVDVTGPLEVVEVCDPAHNRAERWYHVTDEKTGKFYRLQFEKPPAGNLTTGERVRVRGVGAANVAAKTAVLSAARGATEEIQVTPAADGLEVLAPALAPTSGLIQTVQPRAIYGGGTNASTVMHKTLVMLLQYSNYATNYYTTNDINTSKCTPWWSRQLFATNGNSVNTDYLEDSFGAVGFTGDVIICPIASTSGNYSTSTWMSQGDAAAVAQGYTPGNYLHKLYVTSGAGGWAGLATIGYGWAMVWYSDGGTICHELGHNLGFNHASTQWGNTSAWVEYGDTSDFMGSTYTWGHNNGPHKFQKSWVSAPVVTQPGTYTVSRIEDVPATVPYPQVLKFNSSTATGQSVDGWPYYLSYKQSVGFDALDGNIAGNYDKGLNIHRWNGGNTAAIAVLSDGGTFTDPGTGWIIKQLRHDTNSVTFGMGFCTGFTAQPISVALTGDQLAAQTPVAIPVPNSSCDPLTVTNFAAVSAQGGAVAFTNGQFTYTPPGVFTGSDTFTYSGADVFGAPSSATVTILAVTQPHYNWDANGPLAGTGGSGTWDNVSAMWDNGANVWPGTGTSNWAFFGGTAGAVSIAPGGVAANGLLFSADGYVLQNNSLTLNGAQPTLFVAADAGAQIGSVITGAAGLVKAGNGELTLTASNTYTGGTTLSAGTLALGNAAALGAGPLTINGGALDSAVDNLVNSGNNAQNWNGDFTFVGTHDLNLGMGAVALGASRGVTVGGGTLTVGGPIGGGAIGLTKNGPGQLALNGVNSFTGGLTINAGTLAIGGVGRLGGGAYAGAIANYGALIYNSSAPQTLSGVIRGSGTLTQNGPGALSVQVVPTYSGATVVNGGTLQLKFADSASFATPTITVNSGGVLDLATADVLHYTAGVGALTINGGVVTQSVTGVRQTLRNTVNLTGGILAGSSAGDQWGNYSFFQGAGITATSDAAGNPALVSAAKISIQTSGSLPLNVVRGPAAPASDLTISSAIANMSTATGSLLKTGNGVLTLTGGSTYSGATTVNGGVLNITGGGGIYRGGFFPSVLAVNAPGVLALDNWQYNIATASLGGLSAGAGYFTVNGGTIRMNNSSPTSYGRGVTVTNSATLEADGAALWTIDVVNDNNDWMYQGDPALILTGGGNGEFDKVFSGTNSLTKTGGGMWTLGGANTYTGPTLVSNGVLRVNGSLASAAVTVFGGALSGTGVISGAVAVNPGGTLSPGADSIGALTINNTLTLAGGTVMRLDKSAGTNGQVQGVSTLTYGGSLIVTNLGGALAAGDSFPLFNAGSYQGGFAAILLPVLNSGLAWDVSGLATNGAIAVVSFTGVNPPANWPANVTVVPFSTTQMTLNWSAVSNAASYVVSRDGNPVATVSGTNYLDGGLAPLTTYCYSIAAVNTGGSSAASPSVCAATFGAITGVALAWDGDATTAGAQDGSGVWSASTGAWFYNGNDYVWADGNAATFGVNTATNCALTIPGDVTPTSITFNATAGSYSFSGPGAIRVSSGTLPVIANGSATIGNAITGAGGLAKSGGGTLTLAGTDSFTGGTTVSGGTLTLASSGAISQSAGLIVSNATVIQSVGNALGTSAWPAVTLNAGGVLTQTPALGTQAQIHSLTLNGGTLASGGNAGSSFGTYWWRSGVIAVTANSTISATNMTADGTLAITVNGGATLNLTGNFTDTAGGNGGSPAPVFNGSGTTLMSGNNTYSGNTTINGGVLQLATGGKLYNAAYNNRAVITVNSNGTWRLPDFSYGGVGQLADYAARRVLNGGTIEVTGTSQVSGQDFTVNATGGTFRYTTAGQTLTLSGTANDNIQVNGPLTFDTLGNITVAEIMQNGGSVTKTGAGGLALSGASTFTGNVTNNAGAMNSTGGGNGTNASTLGQVGAGSGGRLIVVNAGAVNNWNINNVLGGGGMTAANEPTVVLNGGTLSATRYNAIGNVVLNGGTLAQNSSDSGSYLGYQFFGTVTAGGASASTISSAGKGNHLLGGGVTTFNVAATGAGGADLVVSAPLVNGSGDYSGAGSLAKTGNGVLLLTGANTYTGPTTVGGGTLFVDGSLGAGAVTVAAGGALGGTGVIGGPTTVQSGGTLSPGGTGIGALTINNTLTLSPGGNCVFEISKTGGVASGDAVKGLAGTLTYQGALTVTNITNDATQLAAGDQFVLFPQASGGFTGNFAATNLPPLPAGLGWQWTPGNGTLSVVVALSAPVIGGATVSGAGQVSFTFSGPNGQTYKVIGTNALTAPAATWPVLGSGTFGAGPVTFTDAGATNAAMFYRVVSP